LLLRSRIRSPVAGLVLAVTFSAGCAVPLGPGFRLSSRQMEVAEIAAAPARVHIRVTDVLENIGDRNLAYLEVNLPAGAPFGRVNLSVRVDGRDVAAASLASDSAAPVRVPFDPPWPPKQVRTVVFDYDCAPELAERSVVAATSDGFHLGDPNAFPGWLPPSGLFAKAELGIRKEQFDFVVPREFLVLAPGTERRSTRQDGTTLHRFSISPSDSSVFVIAGRYQQQRFRTQYGDVIFWTSVPLDAQAAKTAAERLAATNATFSRVFGPASKKSQPVRIVETSADLAPSYESDTGISALSFPGGVLLDRHAFAQGIAAEPVLELAEYELARTWFGWRARPRPEEESLMGRGAGLFAVVLAAEERGGIPAREREIARLLAAYDRASAPSGQISLAADSARDRRLPGAFKNALFWAALEDLAGRQNFEHAVRRMVQARAGLDLSVDDLRAAIEWATGRDFYDTFRMWLDRPGIPENFRTRYPSAP